MRKHDSESTAEEFGPHIFDKASDVHSFIGKETLALESGLQTILLLIASK